MYRILAVDIGEKRIGIAISDLMQIIAQPLETWKWTGYKPFLHHLKQLIRDQDVQILVVGIPYRMRGGNSRKTDEILKLIDRLKNDLDIRIEGQDERLTTVMAERSLRDMGREPSRERDKIDQIAAVHILQAWLEKQKPN